MNKKIRKIIFTAVMIAAVSALFAEDFKIETGDDQSDATEEKES